MLCITGEQFHKCGIAETGNDLYAVIILFSVHWFLNARSQLAIPSGRKKDNVYIQADGERRLI